jgi:hypothetical protein
MVRVMCELSYRLTKPKNYPGAYVPWLAQKGFIWERKGEVELKGGDLDSVVAEVKSTAERLVLTYQGDDLEAVKLDGATEIGGVHVRLDILVEKE